MKDAVIFAGWMPSIHRGKIYVDALKHFYGDCDVFTGLNSSLPYFEYDLYKAGMYNVTRTPLHLEVNSDASAFQSALRTFKNTKNTYDKVHFLHTKGVSYQTDEQWMGSCRDYFIGYCNRRNLVKEAFQSDPTVGCVSYVGKVEPMNNSGYSTSIGKYFTTEQQNVEDIMSLVTFYSFDFKVLKQFLDTCHPTFFTDKFDRYFFEACFPLVCDKLGYKRKFLQMW